MLAVVESRIYFFATIFGFDFEIGFMSASIDNEANQLKSSNLSKSRLANLIRQYSFDISNATMRYLKLKDRCKTTQVYAFTPSSTATSTPTSAAVAIATATANKRHHLEQLPTLNSILRESVDTVLVSTTKTLLPYGLPRTDSLEPRIDPYLKSEDFVQSLAELYRRENSGPDSDKSLVHLEQYTMSLSNGDPKITRRRLQFARKHAVDVHTKVVLSAWLRYERREDELVGTSPFDCIGRNLECPKSALIHGYDPDSVFDHCQCSRAIDSSNGNSDINYILDGNDQFSSSDLDEIVCFCIGKEEVYCNRGIGISVEGMRAVRLFSESKKLDSCLPNVVMEILSFANRFCCEEMKSACDNYLASLVSNIDEALILIDYALEEKVTLLTASCLQVILRELPGCLHNSKVMNIFCSSEARARLAMVGHSSFLLFYFLSQVAMEEDMTSNVTVNLFERLIECSTERWQKALAFHQLGCVFLERKEFNEAHHCYEAAAEMGHVYSLAGVARTKFRQGQRCLAHDIINSIISKNKYPMGWMYQERSLYNSGMEKILDLNEATRLDPTLSFPYKYRAVSMVEEKNQTEAAIKELNRILRFKVSSDCLELRAWFHIALEDYNAAIRDIQALLTLEPNYMMFNGKVIGSHLVELLGQHVNQWSPADCWMQLYDRWSSVDDIGSLAVVHQMLINNPEKSILWFRQSLLLLRLNCQKAAMRSLRFARNHSSSYCERLVYEGWILYDSDYREEAITKAEESISLQRSFEAFFLKAYALADTYLDPESASYVIELLEEALRCPSDGLRKGQALNNLGSIFVDCGKLDCAADCYMSALKIKHTRAHQGLARVYHHKNDKKSAYDEMTKLIEKAENKASAYEKRSEYCDRELANDDLSMATQLDPLRTYPYRYRAAVLMDDQKENEAVEELTKAIAFKPDVQMLNLRAAFHESMGDLSSALRDCEAALCLDPDHKDTLNLYNCARTRAVST
ncbi:ethylene-overproduction 1-like isoform X1 [Olea europaea subsp. europaea]|uniref:Ethylene-overproduction 1-like isoform X1 n=1 Tax=Olea europaea subsp. europaea TaxID=158383 RepID=A0A8S0QU89_OLEEU|nr:ethylene-overproduction 1-like isoform X1 [Olea europaea subsp. europaea]